VYSEIMPLGVERLPTWPGTTPGAWILVRGPGAECGSRGGLARHTTGGATVRGAGSGDTDPGLDRSEDVGRTENRPADRSLHPVQKSGTRISSPATQRCWSPFPGPGRPGPVVTQLHYELKQTPVDASSAGARLRTCEEMWWIRGVIPEPCGAAVEKDVRSCS